MSTSGDFGILDVDVGEGLLTWEDGDEALGDMEGTHTTQTLESGYSVFVLCTNRYGVCFCRRATDAPPDEVWRNAHAAERFEVLHLFSLFLMGVSGTTPTLCRKKAQR